MTDISPIFSKTLKPIFVFMKKTLLFLCTALLYVVQLAANTLPAISNDSEVHWYFLQFMNGQNVLTANGDGEKVITAPCLRRASQLWKLEGSTETGLTLTNQLGQRLYVDNVRKEGFFYASPSPAGNTMFLLNTSTHPNYSEGWLLSPQSDTGLFMNQWGGAGAGVQLGLWNDRSDANQPFTFVSEEEFEADLSQLPLIPYPASLTRNDGQLKLSSLSAITYPDESTRQLASRFAHDLEAASGIKLTLSESAAAPASNCIRLEKDEQLGKEAYRLHISTEGITVTASQYAGFFYALQTLRQMLPTSIYGGPSRSTDNWEVPLVAIEDEPHLSHRGFMLDVSRHFFDKEEIKKLIDVAAMYKLNAFHWHLTDDQGWRVEIPEYPKLTTVGAIRKRSLTLNDPTNGIEFYDDTEYGRGCYYTLDDLREVVAYASERNVNIMPEIDMPGHMVAAIAAYPEFSCDPSRTYEVRVAKGVSTDVLNVGSDQVIDFLKCVLDHMAQIFPYEYIHLGGDECPTTVWQNNPDCARRIREEGLAGVHELQPWLVETLGTYLYEKYGKKVVAWNELQDHWKAEYQTELVIMPWTSTPAEAAKRGFRSIYTPCPRYYLDMMPERPEKMETDAPYMGGYGDYTVSTVDMIYNFDPLESLPADQKHLCFGTQGNLWTESCVDNEAAEYQLFPRLLALSETAWLPVSKKNYGKFYIRIQHHDEVLAAKNIRYAPHIFVPAEQSEAESFLTEARRLLEKAQPDAVGHSPQEVTDQLASAVKALEADPENEELANACHESIIAFKQAAPVQPQSGKMYQILSASTYYRNHYEGSSLYVKNGRLNIHYTPQLEPEEIWTFEPLAEGEGYQIRQLTSGLYVQMESYDAPLTLAEKEGTPIRIDRPLLANKDYDHVPGAVMISSVEGYQGKDVRRFFATMSGQVKAYDNATVSYPGTWYIVEVTDFHLFLEKLVDKCERILEAGHFGEVGQPTQEAADFLRSNLVVPAKADLESHVDRALYQTYADIYQQFLDMPRSSFADQIDESHYYTIGNAYFTQYYAKANENGNTVEVGNYQDNDAYLWYFKKNKNGTVGIYNKRTQTAAYIGNDAAAQTLQLGQPYNWTLQEITTDQGNSAIGILDNSLQFSWYTNPSAWSYVLTQPYDWGASVWVLKKTDHTVVGIDSPESTTSPTEYYDLSGRRVKQPDKGVYIERSGKKTIR